MIDPTILHGHTSMKLSLRKDIAKDRETSLWESGFRHPLYLNMNNLHYFLPFIMPHILRFQILNILINIYVFLLSTSIKGIVTIVFESINHIISMNMIPGIT